MSAKVAFTINGHKIAFTSDVSYTVQAPEPVQFSDEAGEVIKNLFHILDEILTQDTAATAWPLYSVMEKREIWGVDADYHNCKTFYVDKEGLGRYQLTEEEYERFQEHPDLFEKEYGSDFNEYNFYKINVTEVESFVTTCFTRKAAEEYIASNKHNLRKPYVYVHSAYRNYEMINLMKLFIGLAQDYERQKRDNKDQTERSSEDQKKVESETNN